MNKNRSIKALVDDEDIIYNDKIVLIDRRIERY